MSRLFARKTDFLLLLAIVLPVLMPAQTRYAVAEVPEGTWKEGAAAILRLNEGVLDVTSGGKARLSVHRVITLLDVGAADLCEVVVGYSKMVKVSDISVQVRDAAGDVFYSADKEEIRDYAAYDGVAFASDARVKVWSKKPERYPITLDVSYVLTAQDLFFLPQFPVGSEPALAVEKTAFVLQSEIPVKVKMTGQEISGFPSGDTWLTTGQWTASRLPALPPASLAMPGRARMGLLLFAPQRFEVDGVPGSFESWKEMGGFYHALNQGLDVLPPAEAATVHRIADSFPSVPAKVEALYHWVQHSTRYVGVQLGVGGFRTFDARYVASNGYGDCKALTNYLQASLKEVGIEAFPALVEAGNVPDIDPTFPAQQFNHVILCVPNGGDSLWVECTSDEHPAGFPGDFTAGRHVLLITPEGGQLVTTPEDSPGNHQRRQYLTLTPAPDRGAAARMRTILTGDEALDLEQARQYLDPEALNRRKLKWISGQSTRIISDTWTVTRTSQSPWVEGRFEAQLDAPNLVTVAGTRRLINTGYFAPEWPSLTPAGPRTEPVFIPKTLNRTDTLEVVLPAGWIAETAPKAASLSSPAGMYTASYQLTSAGNLLIIKEYRLLSGVYPATRAEEIRQFLAAVAKADKAVWMCKLTP